jgi:hypothetical protein
MPKSALRLSGKAPAFLTRPWFYFFVFTAANIVLAYTSLGLETKMWIGLGGFLIPFLAAVWALPARTGDGKTPLDDEMFPSAPAWVAGGVLGLGLLVRLYSWLNSNWIVPDEGILCQLSVELAKKWEWHFFFTTTQIPPLTHWVLSLYYRLVPPSVFSSRFFFFVVSSLGLVLVYPASRLLFSRSASLLGLLFFSFGFWPLLFCEYCGPLQAFLTVEIGVLYMLGRYLGASSPRESAAFGLGLGLATGLGLWVSMSWLLMVGMVAAAVIPGIKRAKASAWVGMASGFLLFFVPFLWLSWTNNNGEHVKFLWGLYRGADTAAAWKNLFSNWTVLFWEGTPGNRYGPVLGGMLNPPEAALCFLGIIGCLRSGKTPFFRWILAAAFVFILPGLLTNGYQIFHNVLLPPILTVFCIFGAQMLLARVPPGGRAFALAALVLVSSGLNLVHLAKSYALSSSEHSNSDPEYLEERRCFSILEETFRQQGPGYVLWDLSTFRENSLKLETYPFNAADNPRLRDSDAHWAAVLCNVHYKYFVERRFPGSRWVGVGPDLFWHQGGLALGVIPLDDSDRAILSHWREADARLSLISRELLFDHNLVNRDKIRKELAGMEGDMGQDPFLVGMFCERVIEESDPGLPGQWLPWIEKALTQGYPSPHLWVAKGALLNAEGKKREARQAFEKAVHSPFNLTDAQERIQNLGP